MSVLYLDTETSKGNCTYLPRDAATGCLTPWSCRECLLKEGCMIGTLGFCESDTLAQRELEYSRAIVTGVAPGNNASNDPFERQQWQFPASSATYCSTSDATCMKCINDQFRLLLSTSNSDSDSRFCVGTDGCVCVANCEISAIDWPACPALSSSSSSSPSSSGDGAAATVTVSPPTASSSSVVSSYDDSCRYHPSNPATGCKRARPCSDCLRTPGCRIGTSDCGFCEVDTYSNSLAADANHFRLAFSQNVTLPWTPYTNMTALESKQNWFFPAFQAKYCPMAASVCLECSERNYELSSLMPLDNRFCVAEDGYICVASCVRSETFESCPPRTYAPDDSGWGTDIYIALGILIFKVTVVVCCWSCFWCFGSQHRRRQDGAAEVPMAVPVAEIVDESSDGWQYHDHLLAGNQPPPPASYEIDAAAAALGDGNGGGLYVQLRRS